MKNIAICILAAATLGLTISTVLLAVYAGDLDQEKQTLTNIAADAQLETSRQRQINERIGMATCLIHGDATPAFATKCRAAVDFFNAKPIEELEEYVKTVGYGL